MLKLLDVPRTGWEDEYNHILLDEYVSKKYNREKRLGEKRTYIGKYIPEFYNEILKSTEKKVVVDLGPGPGEFLELFRDKGYVVIGFDAKIGDSEMGDEYLKLSRLMVERQQLDVRYVGVETLFRFPFEDGEVLVVNSQGSIEQIFKDFLIGEPCRIHKDCRKLSWDMSDKMVERITGFLKEIYRILKKGGVCLIYGNGTKNNQHYANLIRDVVGSIDGFYLELDVEDRLHKIRKTK